MGDVIGDRMPRPTEPDPGGGTPPRPYLGTPNAERYVIAADNLRRRQLRSALLHGGSRTWREQRRIWPGVVAGVVVVAMIVAAIALVGAFRSEQRLQQRRQALGPALTVLPHADRGPPPLGRPEHATAISRS